jgi:hypothetical protein
MNAMANVAVFGALDTKGARAEVASAAGTDLAIQEDQRVAP